MIEMYESAPLIVKIYFVMGSVGTLLYFLKLIGSFSGFDHGEGGADVSFEHDSDLKFFTIQTIALFMMAFGWMGFYLSQSAKLEVFIAIALSVVFGVIAAGFEIWLFWKVRGLEQVAEFTMEECVGKEGQVYLKIPENGFGEVQVSVHGKRKIYKARSLNGNEIQSFVQVQIVAVEESTLVVK